MKLVLLSGGSGTRLWPLSSSIRSKQFLQVLPAPGGGRESMLQRIWRQLSAAGLDHEVYIATSSGQETLIRKQLRIAPKVIIEPRRRDTFPAVSLASAYLYSVEKISPDETVIVLPVDAYVNDEFFFKLTELDQALRHSGAEVALLGAKPDGPSGKYGYIVPSVSSGGSGRIQTMCRLTASWRSPTGRRLKRCLSSRQCGIAGSLLSGYATS